MPSMKLPEQIPGSISIAYMYDHCIFAMFVLRSRNRLLGFPGFEESCDYSPADGHLYIRESKFRLGLGKARVSLPPAEGSFSLARNITS